MEYSTPPKEFYKTFYDQTCNIKFDVIVVDDSLSHGSVDMIGNSLPEVVVIPNDKNCGFVATDNQAFSKLKAKFNSRIRVKSST